MSACFAVPKEPLTGGTYLSGLREKVLLCHNPRPSFLDKQKECARKCAYNKTELYAGLYSPVVVKPIPMFCLLYKN
jgi:hypothetical protein